MIKLLADVVAFAVTGSACNIIEKITYPCDDCASEGRCLRHRACKEYQAWLKENK